MDGVARFNAFGLFEIAGHVESAFPKEHHIAEFNNNGGKDDNSQKGKAPTLASVDHFKEHHLLSGNLDLTVLLP